MNYEVSSAALTAIESNATSYQWLDCDNGMSPILGADQQSFNATSSGSYAVEITQNGCVDTSTCYVIEFIEGVYPNPTSDVLNVGFGKTYSQLNYKLYNPIGKLIEEASRVNVVKLVIDLSRYSEGMYLLVVSTEDGDKVYKLMKQ